MNIRFYLTALIMGALSVPLAFARHLVSLALVLSVLSLMLWMVGRWQVKRGTDTFTPQSLRHARLGMRTAVVGLVCSVVMWMLYAKGVLPR